MAWATKITSAEQVEYRLEEACGCDAEHRDIEHQGDVQADVDRQVDYRLQADLRWIGSGLHEVDLVAGEQVDKDAARALMDGRHPSRTVMNATGERELERLVEPKQAVAPAARVPAAPYVQAIRGAARAAGVEPGEVFRHATAAARFARLERGLLRDGDAHTIPIGDLEQLAAAAWTTVGERSGERVGVQVPGLGEIYPAPELADARAHRDERVRVDQRGTDVVLNLPKSVSALYAVADESAAAVIEAEYMAAVTETIEALEGWAGYGVSGHHGDGQTAERVASSGFVGWTMLHKSARPVDGQVGDPHLHAHAVLAHMVRCEDGEWRAPGSGGRDIYRHVAASGELVKARVRARLTARLGVEWEHEESNGEWEIRGIPRELREQFSSRARQIQQTIGAAGGASAAEQRVAAAKLAEARPAVEPTDVRARWRAAADQVVDVEAMLVDVMPGPGGPGGPGQDGPGLGPVGPQRGPGPAAPDTSRQVSAVTSPETSAEISPQARPLALPAAATVPAAVPSAAEIAAVIWSGEGSLTAHTKAVTRVQVLTAVAAACPAGVADVEHLERLTDAVIEAGPTIAVPQLHASHHSNTARWTTRDIVDAEHTITTGAAAGLHASVAAVDEVLAEAVVTSWAAERGLTLSGEQGDVVARLTTAGHGVDAVIGVAGAGKTTLMAAARTVWEDAGYSVAGASTAAVASAGLAAEAGIESRTIASWLRELDTPQRAGPGGPRGGLRDVDVLIIDEAAMVDDRALARLITAAQVSPANPDGTKIVAIGDPQQLRAIGVGGGFQAIHDVVDGAALADNRRQRDPLERQALATWREGARRTALDQLAGAGRIHAVELPEQAHEQMLTAWDAARARYGDPHAQIEGLALLAARNGDVEHLNAGARAIRIAAGELPPDSAATLYRRSATAGGGAIALAPGDIVRVRQNDYRSRRPSRTGSSGSTGEPDVLNGYRAVVTAVDDHRQVRIEWARSTNADPGVAGGQRIEGAWISPEQIAGGHLSHGYAMTIAASQGLTCDLTLASGVGADAHSLYPALTRARESTHLWLARTAVEDEQAAAVLGPATDTDRLARTIAAYAEHLDRDQPDSLISELLTSHEHDQTAGHVRAVLTQARHRADTRPQPNEPAELVDVVDAVDVVGVVQPAAGADRDRRRRDPEQDHHQEPDDHQEQEVARAELSQVRDYRQRPYGKVPTGALPGRIAAAQQRADAARRQVDAAQQRLQALTGEPIEDRLARARAQLAGAATAEHGADMHARRAEAIQGRIYGGQHEDYRDRRALEIEQAARGRVFGDVLGRHARAADDLQARITERAGQLAELRQQHQRALAEAHELRQGAIQVRKDLGGSYGHEPDHVLLDNLTRRYTNEEYQLRSHITWHTDDATKNEHAAAGLRTEGSLRQSLSPQARQAENTDRTKTNITEAAAKAKTRQATLAAERTNLARHRADDPHRSPGRPSLGR